ncbi:MAG TPA: isoprenyl transferase [Smithellaceae bacterium]|nr:isoprenyl transferase [Smithellaceae bacterium]
MINLDKQKLPRHIAVIMDGNGRWAKMHTIGRILGHKKGAEAVRTTVRTCREIGIKYLTLFAFSVENWSRPSEEIDALMSLLEEYLDKETNELNKQGIRLRTIGNIGSLYKTVRDKLDNSIKMTAGNEGMILNLALSYGARDEIIEGVKKITQEAQQGKIRPEDITKEKFGNYLYTKAMPDPDLLIRTSGEYRISNFLLWQMAYTEFYFTDVLWPDFGKKELLKAIAEYQNRERRFGLTSEQLQKNISANAKI